MIKIEVRIKGLTPLMQHRLSGPITKQPKPAKKVDFKQQAEDAAYRSKDGTLFAPSRWIKACLRDATPYMQRTRPPLKRIICGGVFINPKEIPILDPITNKPLKKYVIDLDTVNNPLRGRVTIARPRMNHWAMEFFLEYNPAHTAGLAPESLKDLLAVGGTTLGIGAYGPRCSGEYGTFEIEKYEVLEE